MGTSTSTVPSTIIWLKPACPPVTFNSFNLNGLVVVSANSTFIEGAKLPEGTLILFTWVPLISMV